VSHTVEGELPCEPTISVHRGTRDRKLSRENETERMKERQNQSLYQWTIKGKKGKHKTDRWNEKKRQTTKIK
jgi:hypothetical protein